MAPMNHFELTGEEYKQFCELIYRVGRHPDRR